MFSSKRNRRGQHKQEAELDITAFMNLMIVLVPVLLLGMVFSQITVIELKLPSSAIAAEQAGVEQQLEVVILDTGLRVNYPEGILLREIPKKNGKQDVKMLSDFLQQVKRELREKGVPKKSISLLSMESTPYQEIVLLMDSVRSFQTVVATSVVNAELFPLIALGDAPMKSPQIASVNSL
ncbi:MAG: biopolymer transporter ExbD [Pseudomonadales bacterium]|nr:biopolymer transporter ExbD [Pseudomonadales bacterium]